MNLTLYLPINKRNLPTIKTSPVYNTWQLNSIFFSCLFSFSFKSLAIYIFYTCRPDTQSYIDKIKREESEKVKGGKEDNRSFIAKYVSRFVILCIQWREDLLLRPHPQWFENWSKLWDSMKMRCLGLNTGGLIVNWSEQWVV